MNKKVRFKKPSKQNVLQFILFNFGGTAFFVIGYAVFAFLYGVHDWAWWTAKIVADSIGWTANYIIQRYLAFKNESKGQKNKVLLGKFLLVSFANVPIDYAIVGGLRLVGVSPFIGLCVSSRFFTVWKYLWYKFWVFKKPSE